MLLYYTLLYYIIHIILYYIVLYYVGWKGIQTLPICQPVEFIDTTITLALPGILLRAPRTRGRVEGASCRAAS